MYLEKNTVVYYTVFSCDRVKFLHSSSHDDMFWTFDENSLGYKGEFQLLLSSAYTESRAFLSLPRQRIWEGAQLGLLTPIDQRDIPDHTASWSAYRAGEEVMTFVFPSHHHAQWSLTFLRMAEHLPAHGEKWINSYFPLLALGVFALLILSLPQPLGLLTFALPILSPIPPGEVSKWLCEAELPTEDKPW